MRRLILASLLAGCAVHGRTGTEDTARSIRLPACFAGASLRRAGAGGSVDSVRHAEPGPWLYLDSMSVGDRSGFPPGSRWGRVGPTSLDDDATFIAWTLDGDTIRASESGVLPPVTYALGFAADGLVGKATLISDAVVANRSRQWDWEVRVQSVPCDSVPARIRCIRTNGCE